MLLLLVEFWLQNTAPPERNTFLNKDAFYSSRHYISVPVEDLPRVRVCVEWGLANSLGLPRAGVSPEGWSAQLPLRSN